MELIFKKKYEKLSDKEIVVLITDKHKHNEEAATYLLWDRYSPVLHSLFLDIIKDMEWYDYAVESLFIYLRGEDGQWHKLSSFEWRSTFGYWFKKTSKNHFLDVRKELIEKKFITVSIDDDDPGKLKVQVSDSTPERNLTKALVLEAIRKLGDRDQKFCIQKDLEGYSSKEIAILLNKSWQKHGIVKFSNKKDASGNYPRLVASNHYVDNKIRDAKKELRRIIVTID